MKKHVHFTKMHCGNKAKMANKDAKKNTLNEVSF